MESPPPIVLSRTISNLPYLQPLPPPARHFDPENHPVADEPPGSKHSNTSSNSESDDSDISSLSDASSDSDISVPKRQSQRIPDPNFLQRVTSTTSRVIPRARRRGLFSALTILPEIEKPIEYEFGVKVLITIVVAAAGAAAPMASAILYPALGEIQAEFNTSPTMANLTVAIYMLSMAIFPLWWSSFAERAGYRTIFCITFALYVVGNVGGALATSIGMLILFRVISGASAASAMSIGAGVIASIWDTHQRGEAMGYFYLGSLAGPLVAPVVGGFLTQAWHWRGTQWFLAAYGSLVFLSILFCLPETLPRRAPVVCEKQNPEDGGPLTLNRTLTRLSTHTKAQFSLLKMLFVDPLRSLLFLRFPPVFLTVMLASTSFGSLYVLNVSLQTVFSAQPYGFSSIHVGLMYIPGALGNILSSAIGGKWNDAVMRRAAMGRPLKDDGTLDYRPEDRMSWNAVVAGCMFPAMLLWYGWSTQMEAHWAVAAVGTFFFGFAAALVFSMATTMLTEFVPGKASSAVAVNTFVRNIASCIGSIVVAPCVSAIGTGWFFTIISCFGFSMLSVVWLMQRYGPRWRDDVEKYRKYM